MELNDYQKKLDLFEDVIEKMEYKGCSFKGKTDEEAKDMISNLLLFLALTCKEQGWSLEHIAELTLAKLARKR